MTTLTSQTSATEFKNLSISVHRNGDTHPRLHLRLRHADQSPLVSIRAKVTDDESASCILREIADLEKAVLESGHDGQTPVSPEELHQILKNAARKGAQFTSAHALDSAGIVEHYRHQLSERELQYPEPQITHIDLPKQRKVHGDSSPNVADASLETPIPENAIRWTDIILPLDRAPETSEHGLISWMQIRYPGLLDKLKIDPDKVTFMETRCFGRDPDDYDVVTREHLCLMVGENSVISFHSRPLGTIELMASDPAYSRLFLSGGVPAGALACHILLHALHKNVSVLKQFQSRALLIDTELNAKGALSDEVVQSVVPSLQTSLNYSAKKIEEMNSLNTILRYLLRVTRDERCLPAWPRLRQRN